jgi:hypothetical protein
VTLTCFLACEISGSKKEVEGILKELNSEKEIWETVGQQELKRNVASRYCQIVPYLKKRKSAGLITKLNSVV